MEPLFSELSLPEAESFNLVLTASNIPHTITRKAKGFELYVPPAYEADALRQILSFQSENQPWKPEENEEEPVVLKNASGLWAAAALLVFYLITGPQSQDATLFHEKGALAEAICHGQVWRTVTALFLHVDFLHLLGNMAGMAIFVTAVGQTTGYGVGLALVLATGILGNSANAVFQHGQHLSVGASTAVFGALGLLGGFKLGPGKNRATTKKSYRPWLILATGITLLALLGNSPRSDLMAHVFGWVSGILCGMAYRKIYHAPLGPRAQFLCMYTAIAVIAAAWAFSGF